MCAGCSGRCFRPRKEWASKSACASSPTIWYNPRCRANAAHVRQSRPDSGLGFQVDALKTFQVVPFSLRSVQVPPTIWCRPRRTPRCRVNMAHIAQSRPDCTVKATFWPWLSKPFELFPLRSAAEHRNPAPQGDLIEAGIYDECSVGPSVRPI